MNKEKTCGDCIHSDICSKQYSGLNQEMMFKECKKFKDKSRYIELPCAVGDVVYDICTIFDESTLKPKTIIKPRIIDFVSSVGIIIESKGLVIGEKEFGKTVFLTKEEAEQALQARISKELDYVKAKDLDKNSSEFKAAVESLNRL